MAEDAPYPTKPWEEDPYTRTHDRLWEIIKASPWLKPTERPKRFVEDEDKLSPNNLTPAMSPEFRIRPTAGGGTNMAASSTTTSVVKAFRIDVATDDLNPQDNLYPVAFGLLRTFALAEPHLGLKDIGVTGHRILDEDMTQFNDEANRTAVRRWSSVVVIAVNYAFSRKELIQT